MGFASLTSCKPAKKSTFVSCSWGSLPLGLESIQRRTLFPLDRPGAGRQAPMQPTAATLAIQIAPLTGRPLSSVCTARHPSAHLGERGPLGKHGLLCRMPSHERRRQRTPRTEQGATRKGWLVRKDVLPAGVLG